MMGIVRSKLNNSGNRNPMSRSQKLFLADGVFINGAYSLTTGTVLSGYAISLGAGDFLTAMLSGSAFYTTILSILSFVLFERRPRRKRLLLIMNLISRLLIFSAVLLPLGISDRRWLLFLLAGTVIVSDAIWGIYRIGWTVWMMKTIPDDAKTTYIYFRMLLIRIFLAGLTLFSGIVLDIFHKGYMGFLILFSTSFVLSLLDVLILSKVNEVEYDLRPPDQGGMKQMLQPLRHKSYRGFLLFVFSFFLLQMMASSYTSLYLIKHLNFDYKFISLTGVVAIAAMVLCNQLWAKMERQKGYAFVLGLTAILVAAELLVLSFLSRESSYLLYLSTLLSGIGMSGFGVSLFTYRYSIMPESNRTLFEGWFYLAYGLGVLAAPALGSAFLTLMPEVKDLLFFTDKLQLLFLFSFLMLSVMIFKFRSFIGK